MSIDTLATFLLLPYIRNNYVLLAKEARAKDYSYEQFLEQLLQGETDQRRNNSLYKRIRKARFPYQMELGDFKTEHLSTELKRKIKQLENLEFIRNRENIILVGNPGTGKTALSIALGMKACREYRNVLFISVPLLMMEISEAMSNSQIIQYKKRFEKYDLVILDELGYCSFSKDAGELLFNLLSSLASCFGSTVLYGRHCTRSLALTFHPRFSKCLAKTLQCLVFL